MHPTVQSLNVLFSLLKGKSKKSKLLDMRKVVAIRWVSVTCIVWNIFRKFDKAINGFER